MVNPPFAPERTVYMNEADFLAILEVIKDAERTEANRYSLGS